MFPLCFARMARSLLSDFSIMHDSLLGKSIASFPVGARSGPRLGIIGGGQLAKMIAQAAAQFGCEITVLDRETNGPASRVVDQVLVGNWDDPAMLLQLAQRVDVVTLENEFVDAAALRAIESAGHRVFPTARSIALTQDKLKQKEILVAAGLPVAEFRAIASPGQIEVATRELGLPLVLKKRRNGYDGKGNYTLRSSGDVPNGWRALGGVHNELLVEAFVPFCKELAVIVTRGRDHDSVVYPVVESMQQNHVCHAVIVPGEISEEVAALARDLALRAVSAVGGVGSFGVEMFLTTEGKIIINELAPRVHNTGHFTIEACACSQFENHVRAVLGWPLGPTQLLAPAAAMVNLLGTTHASGHPFGVSEALAVPGAHLHLYGKAKSEVGRKMGHITALGSNSGLALATAQRAAEALRFTSQLI